MENITVDPIFILNDKNVLITENDINNIFKKYNLNHKVHDLNLFINATTHTSYCISSYTPQSSTNGCHKIKDISICKISDLHNVIPLQNKSYERLEFVGDSTIHLILAEYFYDRYSDQQEGFMTKLRTKIENGDSLAHFSQILGLETFILLSRFMEEKNSRNLDMHILEDTFEAFIGALFQDNKDNEDTFKLCKSLVIQLIEKEIDIAELIFNETNYKDLLLQYAHTKKWPDPIYGTVGVYGSDNKSYEMFVKIKNNIEGTGVGNSKKKGEQLAAAMALKKFRVIHDSDDSDDSDEEYAYEEDE